MLDHKVLVIRLHNRIDWNLLRICLVEQHLIIEIINRRIRKRANFSIIFLYNFMDLCLFSIILYTF